MYIYPGLVSSGRNDMMAGVSTVTKSLQFDISTPGLDHPTPTPMPKPMPGQRLSVLHDPASIAILPFPLTFVLLFGSFTVRQILQYPLLRQQSHTSFIH